MRYLAAVMCAVLLWQYTPLKAQATVDTAGTITTALTDTIDSIIVYKLVSTPAEFVGGNGALIAFIEANLKYPALEADNDIEGQVIVQFIVNDSGRVIKPTLIKKASRGLDLEAVRIVRLLPPFIPATYNGKKVCVSFTLPVNFVLRKPKKED